NGAVRALKIETADGRPRTEQRVLAVSVCCRSSPLSIQVAACARARCCALGAALAFLHEAVLRSAGELLAILVYRLGGAFVALALLHEARLRRADEGLAVLAHRFALAAISLREGGGDGKGCDHSYDKYPYHVCLHE